MNKSIVDAILRVAFFGCLCTTLVAPRQSFAALLYDTETLLQDPPRVMDDDNFGLSVDISGSNIIASAPAPFALGFGRVFVESLTGPGTNVAVQQIFEGGGAPGYSVAIDGNRAVVGIPSPSGHFDFTGDVAFFQEIGGSWVQQASVSKTNDFGIQVAISGTTAVALRRCGDHASDCTPDAFVYVQSGSDWVEQAELPGSGPIAISGDTLLIGPAIYFRIGTTWEALAQSLSGPATFASEAIDANIAVVGTGSSVYIFENISGNWMLQQQIFPSDSATGFGRSVDVKGTRIVVGAYGAAYVFDRVGGTWVQLQKLLPLTNPLLLPDNFGASVAIGERGVVVGAPGSVQLTVTGGGFGHAGAVFLFTSSAVPVTITSASASPSVLWPPNHKLVPVNVFVNTTGSPSTCRIVSVTSDQPVNGAGDGSTAPDWVITGDLTVLLRAERAGNIKTDRVYTITVECADTFGDTARQNVRVTVPHDQGK